MKFLAARRRSPIVASGLLVFAFIASLFLPHVELRSAESFQKARAGGSAEGAAEGDDAEFVPPAMGH